MCQITCLAPKINEVTRIADHVFNTGKPEFKVFEDSYVKKAIPELIYIEDENSVDPKNSPMHTVISLAKNHADVFVFRFITDCFIPSLEEKEIIRYLLGVRYHEIENEDSPLPRTGPLRLDIILPNREGYTGEPFIPLGYDPPMSINRHINQILGIGAISDIPNFDIKNVGISKTALTPKVWEFVETFVTPLPMDTILLEPIPLETNGFSLTHILKKDPIPVERCTQDRYDLQLIQCEDTPKSLEEAIYCAENLPDIFALRAIVEKYVQNSRELELLRFLASQAYQKITGKNYTITIPFQDVGEVNYNIQSIMYRGLTGEPLNYGCYEIMSLNYHLKQILDQRTSSGHPNFIDINVGIAKNSLTGRVWEFVKQFVQEK